MADANGRLLSLSVVCGETRYTVICAYAPCPSVDRKTFFTSKLEPLMSKSHLVLLGDLNTVLDSAPDRLFGSQRGPDSAARLLADLIRNYRLCDVYPCFHPGGRGYS